jgi:hypothetical protein
MRPMETNIQRQPKEIIRTVSRGGAMVGPSEEAQFQIPVGNPRSRATRCQPLSARCSTPRSRRDLIISELQPRVGPPPGSRLV